jgi:hypothetical protein
MENVRGPLIHLFGDLVSVFGRTGAEVLLCLVIVAIIVLAGFCLVFGYMLLHFGEASFGGARDFVLEAFRVFRYQPSQKTHPSIRIELHFDAALMVVILLSLVGLLAHALIPWVTEHSEDRIFEVFVSSAIIFTLMAGVSITIAIRLPRD